MRDEYNIVTLENGTEYTELYRVTDDGMKYVFLSNLDNPEEFCIRKLIEGNGQEFIIRLDGKREYNKVFNLFKQEYFS